jgi:hypothetical protein
MRNDSRFHTSRPLRLLFALVVCACGRTPAEQADRQSKAAAAAVATVELVASEWVRRAVPQNYAERTISAAQVRIDEAMKQLESLASSDATASTETARLKAALAILPELQSGLQKSDRVVVERTLGELKVRRSDLPNPPGGA